MEPNVLCWLNKKIAIKRSKTTQKAFLGPKHGNFNAVDENVLEFVLEMRKNGLLITRETIKMKALEIAASLKGPWQVFKVCSG
jgi:hypothetical protein